MKADSPKEMMVKKNEVCCRDDIMKGTSSYYKEALKEKPPAQTEFAGKWNDVALEHMP